MYGTFWSTARHEKIAGVTAMPSVSYSITVRLEVPAGGSTVSKLTTAVEQAGGLVTALDVTASGHERLRIDVTCAAPDPAHAGRRAPPSTPAGWSRRCARSRGSRSAGSPTGPS